MPDETVNDPGTESLRGRVTRGVLWTGGGQVSGKIEPYAEPLCSCTVETEFVGKFAQDKLEGTFTTRPVGGKVMQTGTWQAVRKAH